MLIGLSISVGLVIKTWPSGVQFPKGTAFSATKPMPDLKTI
jgi:hypothetical protein